MDQHPKKRKTEFMSANEKLAELRDLQSRADAIRQDLGISSPRTVTFLAPRGPGTARRAARPHPPTRYRFVCVGGGNHRYDRIISDQKLERLYIEAVEHGGDVFLPL